MIGIHLVERILDGDIGALICALIPFAIATWWIIRIYIRPARKWKPPQVRKSAPTSTAKRKSRRRKNRPTPRPSARVEEALVDANTGGSFKEVFRKGELRHGNG